MSRSSKTNDEIELGDEKRKMVATINKPKQAKKDYTLSLSVLESKEKIKELQLKLLLEEEEQLLRELQQEEKGQQKQQYSKRQKQQSQFYDLTYWWRIFLNDLL